MDSHGDMETKTFLVWFFIEPKYWKQLNFLR